MSAKHPIIAVTGSSGPAPPPPPTPFAPCFISSVIRRPWWKGTVFIATPARKWTWRSARRANRGATSAISAPRPTTSACWRLLSGVRSERRRSVSPLPAQLRRGGALQPDARHLHPWQNLPSDTDLLFYEGLHGGVVTDDHNVARHVDFLIGVVPIVNLGGSRSSFAIPRARPFPRGSHRLHRPLHGRLHQLHHPSSPAPTSTSSGCRRWIPPTPSAPR